MWSIVFIRKRFSNTFVALREKNVVAFDY